MKLASGGHKLGVISWQWPRSWLAVAVKIGWQELQSLLAIVMRLAGGGHKLAGGGYELASGGHKTRLVEAVKLAAIGLKAIELAGRSYKTR